MLIIDLLILFLSLLCTAFMFRIWQLVKGKGRILLILAFAYLSIVRILVVRKDLTGISLPTAQLTLPFFILMALGLGVLLLEVKRTLH